MENNEQFLNTNQQQPEPGNSWISNNKYFAKKIILIIVGVVVLAGIGFSSWWGYNNYFKKTTEENNLEVKSNMPINNDAQATAKTIEEERVLAEKRDAKIISDIKQIQIGLELYYEDQHSFPKTSDKVVLGSDNYFKLCADGFRAEEIKCIGTQYMTMPLNLDSNGIGYVYESHDGKNYKIYFSLETGIGKYIAGNYFASETGISETTDTITVEGVALAKLRDTKRISDIRLMQTALELYFVDHNSYPIAEHPVLLGSSQADKLCKDGFMSDNKNCQSTLYMGKVPANPIPGGKDYIYKSIDGKNYIIYFSLEVGNSDLKPGNHEANNDQGIVVESITGGVAVPVNSTNETNKDAKRVSDVKQIQTALELYYVDQNIYPIISGAAILGENNFKVLCDKGFQKDENGCAKIYYYDIKANPVAGGASYYYTCSSNEEYKILFAIEKDISGLKAGSLAASPRGIKNETLDKSLDTDKDNLTDNDEIFLWKTDPYKADTDGDGYDDGNEVTHGYDPLIAGSARIDDR